MTKAKQLIEKLSIDEVYKEIKYLKDAMSRPGIVNYYFELNGVKMVMNGWSGPRAIVTVNSSGTIVDALKKEYQVEEGGYFLLMSTGGILKYFDNRDALDDYLYA